MTGATLLLDLLTWRRDGTHDDPLDYAPPGKDEWRAWAAKQYGNATRLSQAIPFPLKDNPRFPTAWEVNQAHRAEHRKRVRLLVGALFFRATNLNWPDAASRWHARYWRLTDTVDSDTDLKAMASQLQVLEDIERVPGLFI